MCPNLLYTFGQGGVVPIPEDPEISVLYNASDHTINNQFGSLFKHLSSGTKYAFHWFRMITPPRGVLKISDSGSLNYSNAFTPLRITKPVYCPGNGYLYFCTSDGSSIVRIDPGSSGNIEYASPTYITNPSSSGDINGINGILTHKYTIIWVKVSPGTLHVLTLDCALETASYQEISVTTGGNSGIQAYPPILLLNNKVLIMTSGNRAIFLDVDTYIATSVKVYEYNQFANIPSMTSVMGFNGKVFYAPVQYVSSVDSNEDLSGGAGRRHILWYDYFRDEFGVINNTKFTETYIPSQGLIHSHQWDGAQLAPNGKLYFMPNDKSFPGSNYLVLEIDPDNNNILFFPITLAFNHHSNLMWRGCILNSDMKIYGAHYAGAKNENSPFQVVGPLVVENVGETNIDIILDSGDIKFYNSLYNRYFNKVN